MKGTKKRLGAALVILLDLGAGVAGWAEAGLQAETSPEAGWGAGRHYAMIGSLADRLQKRHDLVLIRWETGENRDMEVAVRPHGNVERDFTFVQSNSRPADHNGSRSRRLACGSHALQKPTGFPASST